MQLLTMPANLFQARKALPKIVGYIAPMFCCGVFSVCLGAFLLLRTDADALRLTAGLFFGCLSAAQISIAAWAGLLVRAKGGGVPAATSPNVAHSIVGGPHGYACPVDSIEPVAVAVSGHGSLAPNIEQSERMHSSDGGVCVGVVSEHDALQARHSFARGAASCAVDPSGTSLANDSDAADVRISIRQHAQIATATAASFSLPWDQWRDRLWPRMSDRMSRSHMLALLCGAAMMSGLFAGLFGTSGPPLMTAYAFLHLDKDDLLGFSAVPAGFLFIRLGFYVFGSGSVFSMADWPVYFGVIIAAFHGFLIGARLRQYINSEVLAWALHALVFVSSALMLGATTNATVAQVYAGVAIAGCTLAIAGAVWPTCVLGLSRCCCARDGGAPPANI